MGGESSSFESNRLGTETYRTGGGSHVEGVMHKQSVVRQRCNEIKMFSPTRNVAGVSGIKRPRGRFRSAHVMVLAWVIFWLNTALFPCCDAFAAMFGDHAVSVSQSVSAAQSAHHSGADESHSERPPHSPESPCDYALNAEPAIISVTYAALPTDRVQFVLFAIATPVAPDLTAVHYAAILAPREYRPPLPFRLYLHTQRLLI